MGSIVTPIMRRLKRSREASELRLGLVWMEATRPGSAPAYHLSGTLRRLESAGYDRRAVRIVQSKSSHLARRFMNVCVGGLAITRHVDVVVARWHPLLLPCALVWRLFRRRAVFLVQGGAGDIKAAHPSVVRLPGFERLAKMSLKLGHAWAAPHPGIVDWVLSEVREGSRVVLLPNGHPIVEGVDAEQDFARKFELPGRYAFFAGALAEWQGIGTMLRATRSPHWPQGVQLVIVGDGACRSEVDSEPSEAVVYLGHQPPAVVRELLRRSVCSLSPKLLTDATKQGISPFKLLEAGLESVPVVASRVPGQSEHVQETHCGILVRPGDSEELASAVGTLARDDDLRSLMGRNGLKAADRTRWEHHAGTLWNLISQRTETPRRWTV